MTSDMRGKLPARDIVDVRLSDAMAGGGCPICAVRARSERGTLDAIIAERVLDLGFREGLERTHGFCRRHATALLEADRRAAGILGSSILYGAMIERRLAALREAVGSAGTDAAGPARAGDRPTTVPRLHPGRDRRGAFDGAPGAAGGRSCLGGGDLRGAVLPR